MGTYQYKNEYLQIKKHKKMKKLQKTADIIRSMTCDTQNMPPTIKVSKVGQKKVLELTYWEGISLDMLNILTVELPTSHGRKYSRGAAIDYPCIFNNRKGGGIVECFTVIWL